LASMVMDAPASSAPISLYLALGRDQRADLEVVAQASLAFAASIRELARHLDSSLEIRIELQSGTEGSLSLNSVIRAVKKYAMVDSATLKTIVVVVLMWFAKEGASWAYGKVLDFIVSKPEISQGLSQDDIAKIARAVSTHLHNRTGQQQLRGVYEHLERDSAITGVGAAPAPNARPDELVPREEFSKRSEQANEIPDDATKRVRTNVERVTLISPVLLPGKRRWRFSFHEGEFGAPIKDTVFVERLVSGQIQIPMVAGIEMDVELQRIEEKIGGVWQPVERNILRVIMIYPPKTQHSLDLLPPNPENGG